MNLPRPATIAILLGVVTGGAAYAQSPGYGPPPASQSTYDDRHYDDRYYDERHYNNRHSPRGDVGFFYEELSPYGDWVLTRDYGWAWFPYDVHPYWRPYSDGRWVVTEYGWTWVSYEPFGWATYHYGRWARDPRFGWLWVPGTIWGPAWVSWQHGGGYLGWAPLPPAVGFESGVGIRLGGFNLVAGIRPDAYSFVPERSFLDPHLSRHMVPTARNVTIIHNTTNITNYTIVNNRVVNRGADARRIEQVTGQRVPSLRVAATQSKGRTEVTKSEVRIYRPERQKLESVRIGPSANAGLRAGTPPTVQDNGRPATQRRDAPEFEVAPRAVPGPRIDPQQLDQIERREQQDLREYQADERRKVDELQQQEIARVSAQAERENVARRHQVEQEALLQQQRIAAQQLEVRQKAKRESAHGNQPGNATTKSEKKLADEDDENKKKSGNDKQQK